MDSRKFQALRIMWSMCLSIWSSLPYLVSFSDIWAIKWLSYDSSFIHFWCLVNWLKKKKKKKKRQFTLFLPSFPPLFFLFFFVQHQFVRNTCVGQKNYRQFLLLTAIAFLLCLSLSLQNGLVVLNMADEITNVEVDHLIQTQTDHRIDSVNNPSISLFALAQLINRMMKGDVHLIYRAGLLVILALTAIVSLFNFFFFFAFSLCLRKSNCIFLPSMIKCWHFFC